MDLCLGQDVGASAAPSRLAAPAGLERLGGALGRRRGAAGVALVQLFATEAEQEAGEAAVAAQPVDGSPAALNRSPRQRAGSPVQRVESDGHLEVGGGLAGRARQAVVERPSQQVAEGVVHPLPATARDGTVRQ